jgi:hypothetical protein
VISAAAFAMVLQDLPHQLGLVIAALSGICIGYASQQIEIRIRLHKATSNVIKVSSASTMNVNKGNTKP